MEVIIEIILVNKKLTKFGVLWLVIDLHSCIRSCWQEIILYSFAFWGLQGWPLVVFQAQIYKVSSI